MILPNLHCTLTGPGFDRTEMGFTDVVEKQVLCASNGWPMDPIDKEIGQYSHLDIEKFVPGSVKILLAAGMKEEELPAFLASVLYDFADSKLRMYWIGRFFMPAYAPFLPSPSLTLTIRGGLDGHLTREYISGYVIYGRKPDLASSGEAKSEQD